MPPADFTWLYLGVLAKAQLEFDRPKEIYTHTHARTHTHTRLNQWREADKGNSLLWQQGSGCNQSELLGVLKELLHNPVIGFNDQDRQQIKMAQDRTSLVQLRKHHSKVGLHFTLHPNDLLWSSGDLFSLHFSHYKQLTTAIMFMFSRFCKQPMMTDQKSVLSAMLKFLFGPYLFHFICQCSAVSLCIDLLPYQQLFCICTPICLFNLFLQGHFCSCYQRTQRLAALAATTFWCDRNIKLFCWSWCVFFNLTTGKKQNKDSQLNLLNNPVKGVTFHFECIYAQTSQ